MASQLTFASVHTALQTFEIRPWTHRGNGTEQRSRLRELEHAAPNTDAYCFSDARLALVAVWSLVPVGFISKLVPILAKQSPAIDCVALSPSHSAAEGKPPEELVVGMGREESLGARG